MYFKYLLENLIFHQMLLKKIIKYMILILDPYIDSNFNFREQSEVIHRIRHNNYFYNCLQNSDTHFRIVKLDKLSEEKTKKGLFNHIFKNR